MARLIHGRGWGGAAVILALLAQWASAQPASSTVADVVSSLKGAAATACFGCPGKSVEEREWRMLLDTTLHEIESLGLLDLTLRAVAGHEAPGFLGRAKRDQDRFDARRRELLDLYGRAGRAVNARNHGLVEALRRAGVGQVRRRELLRPYDELGAVLREQQLRRTLERLRRYELKFGPGAPRLNVMEVLLSYCFQTVRGFGYDPEEGPGPWEWIASIATTYFTRTKAHTDIVSAAELGLRRYRFKEGWGGGGWRGYVKPRYFSFGIAVAGQKTGPLVMPWRYVEPQIGGFVSWGDVKLAVVSGSGRDTRWLLTKQVQLVPLVF